MRGGLLFSILALGTACGVTRPPLPRQSEAMERSARMLRQLDRLEADLHTASTEDFTFAELVDRHGRAQQLACKVTDEHVDEIHRLALAQQQKIQQKRQERLRKRAVAQLKSRRGRT